MIKHESPSYGWRKFKKDCPLQLLIIHRSLIVKTYYLMIVTLTSLYYKFFMNILLEILLSISFLHAKSIIGTVTVVNTENSTFTVFSEGTFYERTITAKVTAGDVRVGYLNRRIVANLVKTDQGGLWLKTIFPADRDVIDTVTKHQRILRRNTITRGDQLFRDVGEYLPTFALFNQSGKLITPNSLKGKIIVLNFIFTRCTVPEKCPAATIRMVGLQRKAKESNIKDLQLITISFDPAFDSPGVLQIYGKGHGVDFSNFWFLTGNEKIILDLRKQFSIETKQQNGTIKHTMATVLVDKDVKIRYYQPGSFWEIDDFIQRIKKL